MNTVRHRNYRFVSWLSILALLFQVNFPVFAQEETPLPTVTEITGIPLPIPLPTESPTPDPETPTPSVSPEETPTPTLEVPNLTPTLWETPTPSDTATPTATPSEEPEQANDDSQGQILDGVATTAALPSASPTPSPQQQLDEQLVAFVLENKNAASLDLESIDAVESATLVTDQADYAPTDSVLISGSHFAISTTYTLTIHSDDPPPVTHEQEVTTDEEGRLLYAYQLDGTYRPNYTVVAKDENGQEVARVLFTDSDTVATVPFTETFGTTERAEGANIPRWQNVGTALTGTATGEDETATADPVNKFAKIAQDGWICRTVQAIGTSTISLTYTWKGDSNATSENDMGIVEARVGGSCTSDTGWTTLENNKLSNTAWETRTIPLDGFSNSVFKLRFRTQASADNEHFRLDSLSVAVPAYQIIASDSFGGDIDPEGTVLVNSHEDKEFTITPNTSFIVRQVEVDDVPHGRLNSYFFSNIKHNHTIHANFEGGWKQPSVAIDLDNDVVAQFAAFSSNDNYAVFDQSNDEADFKNFNVSIPQNGYITGISVALEGSHASNRTLRVQLSKNDGQTFTDTKTINGLTAIDKTIVLGSDTELWGTTWTPEDFSNNNFRLRIRATAGNGEVAVDQIQIKVYANTVSRNPRLPNSCGLDMALVVDTSNSIDASALGVMKDALKNFVEIFAGTPTEVALVSFDDVAHIEQGFTDDLGNIHSSIDNLAGSGFTNWEDALHDSRLLFPNRSDKPDLIVFTSDGNPTASSAGPNQYPPGTPNMHLAPAIEQANSAKDDGIRIVTLGIGSDISTQNLEAISGPNAYFTVDNFSDLQESLANLAHDLCGGSITVNKEVDTDNDGQFEGGNEEANTLGFRWGVDSDTQDMHFGDVVENVAAGTHTIGENETDGYVFTGWYHSRDQEHSCTNPAGTTLPISISTQDESVTAVTLCNAKRDAALFIEKGNDTEGAALNPDTNVYYYITVTAGDDPVNNVTVRDLLSLGFTYEKGSWTAESSVRGDLKAGLTTTEPTYASPGTWNVGNMQAGESVTLAYVGHIADNIQPGLYKDLAWAQGTGGDSNEVIANADTGVFVGTEVRVVDPAIANINVVREEDVLGAATELPATGASITWILAALLLATIGGVSVYFGNTPKKKLRKKIFGIAAFLLVSAFISPSVEAQGPAVSASIQQPKSPTQEDDLAITVVALDRLGRDMTVNCFKKGPSEASFSQFGSTINLQAGGTSVHCQTNSSVISTAGTYAFYAVATAGTDSAQTQTVSVEFDTTPPPATPVQYSKEKTTSCNYKISFRTADDSGRTASVRLYRSAETSFELNADTFVATVPIGSNTDGSYTDTVPECNKTYYYAIRAFDNHGTGSNVVGDSEVHTTVNDSENETQSTGQEPQGALVASENGTILGEQADSTAAAETAAQSAQEQAITQQRAEASQKMTWAIGAIGLGLLGLVWALRKRTIKA